MWDWRESEGFAGVWSWTDKAKREKDIDKGMQQTKSCVLPFVGFTPDDGGQKGEQRVTFTGQYSLRAWFSKHLSYLTLNPWGRNTETFTLETKCYTLHHQKKNNCG